MPMVLRTMVLLALAMAAPPPADWQPLFDGQTFAGWRGVGRDGIPAEHWVIEDGAIRKVASGAVPTAADGQPLEGGDIMTIAAYENFELELEWKIAPGANSGIKYNVSEAMSTSSPPEHAALGFEYQILDDDRHPDAQVGPNRTAGGLYDLYGPAAGKRLKPVGEFNHTRIVFDGTHGEHWLNGVKVVAFDLESEDFAEKFKKSKYLPVPGFADKRKGHIVLQDHGDDVWFDRNGYVVYDNDNNEIKSDLNESKEDVLDTRGGGGMTAAHILNFLEAVRGKEKPRGPIDEGHKSVLLCHLGNIAQRTGRALRCDGKTGHIVDDSKAMKLWSREYASGWAPKT